MEPVMDQLMMVRAFLQRQFIKPIHDAQRIWLQTVPNIKDDVDDYDRIITAFNNGLIKFTKNNKGNTENSNKKRKNATIQKKMCSQTPERLIKKFDDTVATPQSSSGTMSTINNNSSTSPTMSKRVAAQVADYLLEEVHNIIQTKKCRRTTNFSKNQCDNNSVTSPAKSRKISKKKSAGSAKEKIISPLKGNIEELNGKDVQTQNVTKNSQLRLNESHSQEVVNILKRSSDVSVRRASITMVTSNNNTFRRKTVDFTKSTLFSCNANPMCDAAAKQTNDSNNLINTDDQTNFSGEKKNTNFGFVQGVQGAHQFPDVLLSRSSVSIQKHDTNSNIEQDLLNLSKTYIRQKDENEFGIDKVAIDSEKENVHYEKLRTDRNISNNTDTNNLCINDCNPDDEFHTGNKSLDVSWSIRSRTKIIKKEFVHSDSEKLIETKIRCNNDQKTLENEICKTNLENEIREINWGSRTKTIRKHNIDNTENKENDVMKENGILTKKRGKKLTNKKCNNNNPMPYENLSVLGKKNLVTKQNEYVKKINSKVDSFIEKRITRATRNKEKNKINSFTDFQQTKLSCSNLEKVSRTPLASHNNKVTPDNNTVMKAYTRMKGLNTITHQYQIGSTKTVHVVKRHSVEEPEKKIREEQKLRHKEYEDSAKKKKEKALRAAADEIRRKRELKLEKVAAARKAADIEKRILAEKSKKETEGRSRQIPTRRGQKLKRNLTMQPKISHQDEIRKKEEAIFLEKLKTLDEEHNKLIAKKEAEQETETKQKRAEHTMIGKTADQTITVSKSYGSANLKILQSKCIQPVEIATPQGSKINGREIVSYDITPARNERQLLKPKTENDYGIEDVHTEDSSDDETHPKKMLPLWAQQQNKEHLLRVNNYLPKRIWDLFMQAKHRPDVKEVFACNPVRKRTSSAIWKTPPDFNN